MGDLGAVIDFAEWWEDCDLYSKRRGWVFEGLSRVGDMWEASSYSPYDSNMEHEGIVTIHRSAKEALKLLRAAL